MFIFVLSSLYALSSPSFIHSKNGNSVESYLTSSSPSTLSEPSHKKQIDLDLNDPSLNPQQIFVYFKNKSFESFKNFYKGLYLNTEKQHAFFQMPQFNGLQDFFKETGIDDYLQLLYNTPQVDVHRYNVLSTLLMIFGFGFPFSIQ